MPVDRAFQLFDSLVSPVALYATEFWFPHSIPKKSFNNKEQLLSSWESLKGETINQSCSRIILSVHRKTSRLAVMGELGRYPLAVKAISQCLNYRQCLASKPADSLIGQAMGEMASLANQGKDCWLTRVNRMEELLQLPTITYSKYSGKTFTKLVKSCFDRYWLDQIKMSRVGIDGQPHNKLLTYSTFKCCFKVEPYVSLIRNRNQRCHLTRLRVSAHRLGCEVGRYTRPPVPRDKRYCVYCPPQPGQAGLPVRPLDTKCHCLTQCVVGQDDRPDLYTVISSNYSNFINLDNNSKFKMLVCPTNAAQCKAVNRFLDMQFKTRSKIDTGEVLI